MTCCVKECSGSSNVSCSNQCPTGMSVILDNNNLSCGQSYNNVSKICVLDCPDGFVDVIINNSSVCLECSILCNVPRGPQIMSGICSCNDTATEQSSENCPEHVELDNSKLLVALCVMSAACIVILFTTIPYICRLRKRFAKHTTDGEQGIAMVKTDEYVEIEPANVEIVPSHTNVYGPMPAEMSVNGCDENSTVDLREPSISDENCGYMSCNDASQANDGKEIGRTDISSNDGKEIGRTDKSNERTTPQTYQNTELPSHKRTDVYTSMALPRSDVNVTNTENSNLFDYIQNDQQTELRENKCRHSFEIAKYESFSAVPSTKNIIPCTYELMNPIKSNQDQTGNILTATTDYQGTRNNYMAEEHSCNGKDSSNVIQSADNIRRNIAQSQDYSPIDVNVKDKDRMVAPTMDLPQGDEQKQAETEMKLKSPIDKCNSEIVYENLDNVHAQETDNEEISPNSTTISSSVNVDFDNEKDGQGLKTNLLQSNQIVCDRTDLYESEDFKKAKDRFQNSLSLHEKLLKIRQNLEKVSQKEETDIHVEIND